MKRFLKFFSQTWLLALIIIVLLSAIIWFIGPLIAIADYKPLTSETVRLVIIFVMLIAWGLNNLRKSKKDSKQDKEIAKELTENTKKVNIDSATSADEKILAERFNQAIKTLQGSAFGKKGKLYTLPWYVIIGLPGSGKTTALKNSGLQFPLHSQFGDEPIQGSGGTRYCDWWFTNEAILIDTAGRYTSQDDTKKAESKSWNSFLSILKKGRPKRPLNGIIITISLQDILSKTNTQKSLHATAIKQRIQELNHQLNMELPVYVMLTKTDSVAGFTTFFSDMEKEEREQVLGFNFPNSKIERESDFKNYFDQEFTQLMGNINNRVLYLLDHEKAQNKRNLIHQFPHQMHALKPLLMEFLNNIFTPNQFETPLIIRGLYFISSTQSNMGSQWISGSLPTDKLHSPIDQVTTEAKTYFVHDLLKKVIFPEANLANINNKSRRRFKLTYWSLIIVTIITFISTVLLWQNSISLNQDYISELREDVNTYLEKTDGGLIGARDWLSLAKGLNHLRDLSTGFKEGSEDYPIQQGFGLYQGHKLGSEASNTYKKALHAFLMQDIGHLLSKQLANANDDEYLYESLKFYLMLYNPDKMEQDIFVLWVDLLLQRELVGDQNKVIRDNLMSHLATALEQSVSPAPVNQYLVDSARDALVLTPLDLRLYRRIKNDYQKSNPGEFRLSDVLDRNGENIIYRNSGQPLTKGIPKLYTYNGFHAGYNVQNKSLAERLAGEQWIYGDSTPEALSDERIKEITDKVDEYYFADYINLWENLLKDIRIQSFDSVTQGQAITRLIASSEKYLIKMIKAIRKNTALNEVPGVSQKQKDAAGQLAEDFADSETNRIKRLLPLTALGGDVKIPGWQVGDAFNAFNNYAQSEDGLSLQELQKSLNELNNYFSQLANSSNVNRATFTSVTNSQNNSNPEIAVKRALEEAPVNVQAWFEPFILDLEQITALATKDHINNLWTSDVYGFYEKAIKGRYPVDPDSTRDIKLDDFAAFFGPSGILQKYFDQHLASIVDQSQRKWKWTSKTGISDSRLVLFQRAQEIQKAFFSGGNNSPEVSFVMKPLSLDKITSGVLIETGGQTLKYNHGPLRSKKITWPGEPTEHSKLTFTLISRGTPVSSRTDGEWAWFRLLDKHASIKTIKGSDKINVTFSLRNLTVLYQLTPQSSFNPFTTTAITDFTVPSKL